MPAMQRLVVSFAKRFFRCRTSLICFPICASRRYSKIGFLCGDATPREYLISKGFMDEQIIAGMLKPFSPPTVSALQGMGDSGLRALSAAVQRELVEENKTAHLPDISVFIGSATGTNGSVSATPPMEFKGKPGMTFYELHQKYKPLQALMECACGGIAACSTCHVIVDPADMALLPAVEETEQDMLDLAAGLTPNSRLGCQIVLTEEMQKAGGLHVTLPAEVNNLF